MKKLLILFGLNNLLIALLLAYPLWSGKEQLDFTLPSIFLCSIISLFIITAIGLPLRNQFAWSSNFILSALVVIIMPYFFFLMLLAAFHVSRDLGLELSMRLLGRFIIIGVALFSIIRTLRQDITQLLQITKVQKQLTVAAGLLIFVFIGWNLVRFTSAFRIFDQ
ncbi:hypothetical protein [Chryseolinea soli]|uniref:Uncharacterized protein n=1 Tax=Chryseolinea soli TaxID=2321403 RepID=A0A385STG0_9BACT|nr:hypothetical protein [Chryseolinea soli]AYB34489.1 hypothetical protein D4L85_29645 [Chryseolinea soli]